MRTFLPRGCINLAGMVWDDAPTSKFIAALQLSDGCLRGVLLHDARKFLRNVVSNSYAVVVLVIHMFRASDRWVRNRGVCNSRISLR